MNLSELSTENAGERATADNAAEEPLVTSMCERLNALPKRSTVHRPTIFRVPAKLRKNKEYLIEPSVVSIGPYYRDYENNYKHLAPMEDTKWLLLQDIMSPSNNNVTVKTCVERIKGLQLQARSCYREKLDMDEDSFVKMLILDGTFIIQFMQAKSLYGFKRETGWAASCIATDLILLENQIPFFVIQSLWDLYFGSPIKLADLKKFITRLCPDFKLSGNITMPPNKFHHLLHLCHHYVVPDMLGHESVQLGCSCVEICTTFNCHKLLPCLNSTHEMPPEYIIPCASELKVAGIKCRKKKSPCKMMDVTFHGGKLEIPSMAIDDRIKPLFINLLAFEQSHFVPGHFTSYVVFMDSIINTEHDVAILQRHGIIENMLSSEEEVAIFFNQLCDGAIIYKNHYLSDLFKKVNQYYDSKCHRYRAKLMRDYFNSPWSLISFIAAVIILGLTFAQTYFAGFDYFHPAPK